MDWPALAISLKLAFWTTILLIPLGMVVARAIAWRRFAAKGFVEALIALPLVLPPTVLGYYLLTLFSNTLRWAQSINLCSTHPLRSVSKDCYLPL